jgi:hypothetical protein
VEVLAWVEANTESLNFEASSRRSRDQIYHAVDGASRRSLGHFIGHLPTTTLFDI